jgi:hypothetical protein
MKNSGFVSLFTLFNKSRTGAIIETAGRVGSPNPRAASITQMQEEDLLVR